MKVKLNQKIHIKEQLEQQLHQLYLKSKIKYQTKVINRIQNYLSLHVHLIYKLLIINDYNVTDFPRVTDTKFGHETPKKLKKIHSVNSSEHILTKTPRTVRKQIAKG